MRIFGTVLPYIGKVIGPCDADGFPAMTPEEARVAHHEIICWCSSWFGQVAMFSVGEPMPRMIDPNNPRQYAPGNI